MSFFSRAGVALLCLQFAACGTMKTIDNPEVGVDERIRPGRTMIITTTDGEVLEITSTTVTERAIEGKLTHAASRRPASAYATGRMTADDRALVRVPAENIETLEVLGLDGKPTGMLVGAVVGFFLSAFIAYRSTSY